MSAPLIPANPQDFTPEWLTRVLRDVGVLGEQEVIEAVSVEPVGAPGTAGGTLRLRLSGTGGPGTPATLIAKFPDTHPEVRDATHQAGWYATEVRFYHELAESCGWRTPRCYFAAHDEATASSALLLEDLEPAEMGDPPDGVYPDEADRLMRRLAALHARWWENDALSQLQWLRPYGASRSIARGAEQAWEELRGDLRDQLSPEAAEVMSDPDAVAFLESLFVRWDLIGARMSQSPATLIHGDYGRRNMAVMPDGGDPYIEFDFQFMAWGRPGWDLAQFTFSSTLREPDDAYEQRLAENVRSYIDELQKLGIRDYSAAQLREDCTWHAASMSLVMLLVYWATFKRQRPQPSPIARFWCRFVRQAQASGLPAKIQTLTQFSSDGTNQQVLDE